MYHNRRKFVQHHQFIAIGLLAMAMACSSSSSSPSKNILLASSVSGGEGFEYDEIHRLKRVTKKNGQVVDFVYNAMGKLEQLKTPEQAGCTEETLDCLVFFTYNALGNRATMRDATGTTRYDYDAFDRIRTITDAREQTVGYDYDDLGRLSLLAYPSGDALTYDYDDAGRIRKTVNTATEEETSFEWNPTTGLLEATVMADGTRAGYAYNELGRHTKVTYTNNTGGLLLDLNYTEFDELGRVKNMTITTPTSTRTESYEYTAAGQLESVTYDGTRTVSYTYDLAGNRKTVIDSADATQNRTYHYEGFDQLKRIADDADQTLASFEYDELGNLKESTTSLGTRTFEYDYRNLLTKVTNVTTGQIVRYTYNGDGHRVSRSVQANESAVATTTNYVVNPNTSAHSVLEEQSDAGIATTTYLPNGTRQDGVREFLLTDRTGSIRAMLSGDNSAVIDYEPFGVPINPANLPGSMGFAGELYDADTGLLYLRARYYDPSLGRFISRDPLGVRGGPNMYAYVNHDPINYVDPLGTAPIGDVQDSYYPFIVNTASDLNTLFGVAQEGKIFELDSRAIPGADYIGPVIGVLQAPLQAATVLDGDASTFNRIDSAASLGVTASSLRALQYVRLGLKAPIYYKWLGQAALAWGTAKLSFAAGNNYYEYVPGVTKVADRISEWVLYDTALSVQVEGYFDNEPGNSFPETPVFIDGKNPFSHAPIEENVESTTQAILTPEIETPTDDLNVDLSEISFPPLGDLAGTNFFSDLDFLDDVPPLTLELGNFDTFASQWPSASLPISDWNFSGFSLDLTHDPFSGGGLFGGFGGFFSGFGGVLIDKAATLTGQNLSTIRGATFDPSTGRVALIGAEATTPVDQIDPEYFKTALLSVFGSVAPPIVSLDPVARMTSTEPAPNSEGTIDFNRGQTFTVNLQYRPVWEGDKSKVFVRVAAVTKLLGLLSVFEQELVPEPVYATGPRARRDVTVTSKMPTQECPDFVNAEHCVIVDGEILGNFSVVLNKDGVAGHIYAEDCNGAPLSLYLRPNQKVVSNGLTWERDAEDVYRINGHAATLWFPGQQNLLEGRDPDIDLVGASIGSNFGWRGSPAPISVTFQNNHSAFDYGVTLVMVIPEKQHRRFGGRVEGTKMGWAMYEADRIMKCLSVGRCNDAGDPARTDRVYKAGAPAVAGYKNLLEGDHNWSGAIRMWFAVDDMILKRFVDDEGRSTVSWDTSTVRLLSERQLFAGASSTEVPAAVAQFTSHFTTNYDAFASHEFIVSDPSTPGEIASVRIFDELRKVMQAVSFARFLRDNKIPIDMSWASTWKPTFVDVPKSIPTAQNSLKLDELRSIVVHGGVDAALRLDYNATVGGLQAVSAYEPSEDAGALGAQIWAKAGTACDPDDPNPNVSCLDDELIVTSGSEGVAETGYRRVVETDLQFRSAGGVLRFMRAHHPSYFTSGAPMGEGWTGPAPLSLQFDRPTLVDEQGKTHLWVDDNKDTQLRVGTARVVSLATGGYLDFYSTLTVDSSGRIDGLNRNKVPDYLPGVRRNGALLAQKPRGEGFELRLPSGEVHRFDVDGRLLSSAGTTGELRSYTYDGDGRLTAIADESGKRLTMHYEGGLLSAVEGPFEAGNADNERILYMYNGQQLAHVTDTRTQDKVEYAYGDERTLQSRTGPDGLVSFEDTPCADGSGRTCTSSSSTTRWAFEFTRDEVAGEITQAAYLHPADLAALTWQRRFNGYGQMKSFTDANGAVHELIWENESDTLPSGYRSPLPGVQDIGVTRTPDGVVKVFNPNNIGNLDPTTPETTVEWLRKNDKGVFDPETYIGRPYAVVDVKDRRTEFEYDTDTKRLRGIVELRDDHSARTEIVETVSGAGRRVEVKRGSVVTQTTEYDELNRVKSIADATGVVTRYEYNDQGQVYRVYPPQFTGAVNYIEYHYYDNGKLKATVFPDGRTTTLEYDPLTDQLRTITDAKNRVVRIDYDATTGRREATVLVGAGPAGQDLVTSYNYDAFGGIGTFTLPGNRKVSYVPDEYGRLKSVEVGPAAEE